ncbi:alpha/beta fold hydrolase [Alteribacter populi]|uniref:alpha/beta fold hydrolase n=1 Tax=Alteribacter populi TaxID=2011011 RepID=UPI0012FD4C2E|nr:alpha/beta hydrolase [Alteribacter populi]
MNIRGKDLFVEEFGKENEHAILYLHGGPGESCFDFSQHQAERLSQHFRVIAIDQRGVCRSEAIKPEEDFGLDDLVEDCETLRNTLDIKKWSVIGHSFGGYLALHYASIHPDSIHKLIFEGATFDFAVTSRVLLTKTAQIARKYGKDDLANECIEFRNSNATPRELTEGYMRLSQGLEENRMEIYRYEWTNPTNYSCYSDNEWEEFYDRSEIHYNLLRDEGKIFESLLPKIKNVHVPMLMLNGRHDPVACETHTSNFINDASNGQIITFDGSGHTPHYEEPELFMEEVRKFLLAK